MSRSYNQVSINILKYLSEKNAGAVVDLKPACAPKLSDKDFYNYIFRLIQQELATKSGNNIKLTEDGKKLLDRLVPQKDGVWKLVIFDIPEKHKYVRSVLRGKLKQLHFKKWQNSIWVSPYALDPEIEQELADLGKNFFVRLIRTTEINNVDDLEKMF